MTDSEDNIFVCDETNAYRYEVPLACKSIIDDHVYRYFGDETSVTYFGQEANVLAETGMVWVGFVVLLGELCTENLCTKVII